MPDPKFLKALHNFLISALLVGLGMQATAQSDPQQPLFTPFAENPPFALAAIDGPPTGFFIELAREISEELDVSLNILPVADLTDGIDAQTSGKTQFLAGTMWTPVLDDSNVFSVPVATEFLRLIATPETAPLIETGHLQGLRLGVVPLLDMPFPDAALGTAARIRFTSPQAALMALLSGEVHALVMSNPVAINLARRAGIDDRIRLVGEPVGMADRYVAIHKSRSELLPDVNRAIARLEEDGRLAALRSKFFITAPKPTPKILTVGVADAAPYGMVLRDGRISGYAAEAFRELAARARLDYRLELISPEEMVDPQSIETIDVFPIVLDSPSLRERLDMTLGIEATLVNVYARVDEEDVLWTSFKGRKVATKPDVAPFVVEAGFPSETITIIAEDQALALALAEGAVDVVFEVGALMDAAIDELNLGDRIQSLEIGAFEKQSAIGLRPGLGEIRERLNGVIPGYLASEQRTDLRNQFFGEPVFWTNQRLSALFIGVGLSAALLLALLVKQRMKTVRTSKLLAKAHEEQLRGFILKLERSNEDLKRSNRALDEFAYIASHDLKEPLRGIGILTNFLSREDLPDTARKRVERLSELSGRMENLISDLLFFSRLGRAEAAKTTFAPEETLEGIKSELNDWLIDKGGEIKVVSPLPKLHMDPLKFKTILQNLIVNGIRYNESSPRNVEIGHIDQVEVDGRVMENAFFVRDNGIGILEKYRSKIFRIFSRLNKESEYGSGTGSGLAFVRKIAEDYGGEVDFASELGNGATFYVTLPLAHA